MSRNYEVLVNNSAISKPRLASEEDMSDSGFVYSDQPILDSVIIILTSAVLDIWISILAGKFLTWKSVQDSKTR